MFIKMPTAAMVMEMDVPPALKKGNGSPVVGKMPTTPMFRKACTAMLQVMPAASRQPNLSRQFTAMRIPARVKAANSAATAMHPSSPKSSPTMAKMKSLSG